MKYIDKQQLEDEWAKEKTEARKWKKLLSEDPDKNWQEFLNLNMQKNAGADSDSEESSEYGDYYNSIWSKLSKGVKNISFMLDAEIIDARMVGENFRIKFNEKAVEFQDSYLTSVDLTNVEPVIRTGFDGKTYEVYYISRLTFINANVIKNDLSLHGRPHARTTWYNDEVYLTSNGGYELHILAIRHANSDTENDKLDDIILTFDDVIISVVGK